MVNKTEMLAYIKYIIWITCFFLNFFHKSLNLSSKLSLSLSCEGQLKSSLADRNTFMECD